MRKIILFLLIPILSIAQQLNPTHKIFLKNGKVEEVSNAEVTSNYVKFDRLDNTSGFYKMQDVNRIKKIITIIDQFEFKDKTFTDFVIVKIDSLKKEELYKRTLNWIKETYKNPDAVIKMTIENEKIRISGYKEDLICTNYRFLGTDNLNCYYGTYNIEISFKDGKYKFDPTYLEYRLPSSGGISGMTVPMELTDFSNYYNEKGELRKQYEYIPSSLEDIFNGLSIDLYDYILKKKEKQKNDW